MKKIISSKEIAEMHLYYHSLDVGAFHDFRNADPLEVFMFEARTNISPVELCNICKMMMGDLFNAMSSMTIERDWVEADLYHINSDDDERKVFSVRLVHARIPNTAHKCVRIGGYLRVWQYQEDGSREDYHTYELNNYVDEDGEYGFSRPYILQCVN